MEKVGGMTIAMAMSAVIISNLRKGQLYKIVSEIIFRFPFAWPSVALGLIFFASLGTF